MNRIEVNRNRCYFQAVDKDEKGAIIELGEEEKIIFAVKNPCNRGRYLIKKELTNADYSASAQGYLLSLTSDDTDIKPGIYCYDIALQRASGELETIVGESDFVVRPSTVTN